MNLSCLKFKKKSDSVKNFSLPFVVYCAVHGSADIGFLQTSGTSTHSEGQENKTGTSICSDLNSHDRDKKKINK